ncbi:MAG: hypothetical protein IKQ46_17855, partial [Bacteroidales bacterium]|nr:hypothetical protein [Bacteroidales bacterium]
ERVFEKLFRQAEIAMFTPKEYSDYEESLHNLWDITNAMNDAETKGFGKGKEQGLQQGLQQGRAEGRAEGEKIGIEKGAQSEKLETAKRMKLDGLPIEVIAKYTQLSVDEIEKL